MRSRLKEKNAESSSFSYSSRTAEVNPAYSFLSSLLPPTLETIQLALSQGGYNSSSTHQNPFALNSTTSLTSSQLSHQFNNSPAMALSNFHHTKAQIQGEQQFLPPPPPSNLQAHLLDDPRFSALITETRTILCSSDFSRVLEVCLDTATETLFAGLEKNVFVPNEPEPGDDMLRIRLAGLLPGLARWSQLALNGLPNELVDVSFVVFLGLLDTNFLSSLFS